MVDVSAVKDVNDVHCLDPRGFASTRSMLVLPATDGEPEAKADQDKAARAAYDLESLR